MEVGDIEGNQQRAEVCAVPVVVKRVWETLLCHRQVNYGNLGDRQQ